MTSSFSDMIDVVNVQVDLLIKLALRGNLTLDLIYFIFILFNFVRRRKEVNVEI